MNTTQPRVGAQRPGGRAERVRAAVLLAAAELLTEFGYDKMRVEDVAARAGVHKTTVYRRWPTKASLTADAAALHSVAAVPISDTGAIVGDLKLLVREVVANIGTEGGSRRSRSVTAAAATWDELATAMHGFWANRLALPAKVVERAIQRGELPASTDAKLIIETVVGPLWVRLLLTGEPITEELADRVVQLVITGATHR
jgi:AcrR family transcriptional regulator